jgi:hypothetical protein
VLYAGQTIMRSTPLRTPRSASSLSVLVNCALYCWWPLAVALSGQSDREAIE